ncbi:phenylalanine--tRNA ligase [Caenorhabditis elegans]|uniref:phenylalanine--tRNA ligase n=2 Tax=Caenorhabditis elegans TaxID=6239 RepID=Q9GYS8_CAEEL|nr:phenylalanine--tRNA ligase [Caenorhabditis elegans]CCD67614.1 phenylalanine--tRNA ligase [Caenorhabditis elegans]|eukprot:NP_491792.1 Phenylalanyl Amino-acyl tRNA Synthetase [Caenorhabditis elegans]
MTDPDRLNQILQDQPYIEGFVQPSAADFSARASITEKELKGREHLERWFQHLSSFEMTAETDVRSTENLPQQILDFLQESNEFNSIQLAQQWNLDHQKVIGAIKSLLANEGVLTTKDVTEKRLELTNEGVQFANEGSPEYLVFEFVGTDGAAQADIQKKPFGKIGMAKAMQFKWVSVDKGRVVRQATEVTDSTRKQLESLRIGSSDVSENEKKELKKRKLISEVNIKALVVSKGTSFTTSLAKQEADLTPEMIASGSWKDMQFKKYNFDSLGVVPSSGHLHPLMKVRSEFRQIFFSMGFSEMATNRYVESSFWNFDALFQPQQHPARDAHDTFFVSDPAISTKFPEDYLERVKTVHSKGGYGSAGYNYDWKIEEAQKNVLRTHTTAVSARQLYQLAQEGFRPSKLFSIDRVFRNETLDATHLAEFHQVEGVIAEKNLSLAHLIGIFTEFFKKLGITNLRFKPTYNPYTEPSMEIFAYHQGLTKWVEIGNSGMFRPEMLLPMGLPADVNVAGYGLSLERPTMIKYGINNIRDLFGSKIDLNVVYNNPICRLDK